MKSLVIDSRFCGPPRSGNGGYVCGVMAEAIGPAAEISLLAPPPVESVLEIRVGEEGALDLWDGQTRCATGHAVDDVPLSEPVRVDFDTAQTARGQTPYTADNHPLPSCFVCSPIRATSDGLGILAGPLPPSTDARPGAMAAPWAPSADLVDGEGRVLPRFIWSALDCPSGYVVAELARDVAGDDGLSLLGRMRAQVRGRPKVGERCVITAWPTGTQGRKLYSEVALFGADAEMLAWGKAIWIAIPDGRQKFQ